MNKVGIQTCGHIICDTSDNPEETKLFLDDGDGCIMCAPQDWSKGLGWPADVQRKAWKGVAK